MRRGDRWVIGLVLLLGTTLLAWRQMPPAGGRMLVVEVDRRIVGRYPLTDDGRSIHRVRLDQGWAVVEVQRGAVRLRDHYRGSCPREICKQTGWIKREGESIICIPKKLVLKVAGKDRDIDGIAR